MTTTQPAGVMSEFEARRLTKIAQALARTARDSIEQLQEVLTQARDGQAWVALGFASWTAYLAEVMGDRPLRLERTERQALVGYLAGEGMSSRAIAPIVGSSRRTVSDDIAGGQNCPPDDVDVNPVGGFVSAGEQVPSGDPMSTGDVLDPGPSRVTGLDGKSYPRPDSAASPADGASPKRSRKPVTDSFWAAAYDLSKKVDAVYRLTEDDRFPQNAEKVAAVHRNDLIRYRDLLQEVIDRLPTA